MSQKVYGNTVFTNYWKVLVLNFSVDGSYGLFCSQKVDEKMIFNWSLWGLHDISGLEKYGFLCSEAFNSSVLKKDDENVYSLFFINNNIK